MFLPRFSFVFFVLALLAGFGPQLSKANVPVPPQPLPVPAGYCSTMYGELNIALQNFNQILAVPPTWTPIAGGPTVWAANLLVANANTGPAIGKPLYLSSVLPQLNEEKAMGAQAILVQIGFPVLYAPFQ